MNKKQTKLLELIQEKWDKKYPGLELQFRKHEKGKDDYDAYLLNWSLIGRRGIAKGKIHSLNREEVEGRYINFDIFRYTLEMIEKEFEHWAVETILKDYRE